MIIRENEELAKHVTMRIGGIAKTFCIPQTQDELLQLMRTTPEYKILSGGSNLLINDRRVFPCVISMEQCCDAITRMDEHTAYVGASVRIQKVIHTLGAWGMGGFEFLYSLPALLGGVVFMNAGRGSDRKCIGDFVQSIRYADEAGNIGEISQKDCAFEYRQSVFQRQKWVILGATLRCEPVSEQQVKDRIAQRLASCKTKQDMRYPNFGSVFCKSSARIMKAIRRLSNKSRRPSTGYSDVSVNWMINRGAGTYRQAMRLIRLTRVLHRLTFQPCEVEVRIWNQ